MRSPGATKSICVARKYRKPTIASTISYGSVFLPRNGQLLAARIARSRPRLLRRGRGRDLLHLRELLLHDLQRLLGAEIAVVGRVLVLQVRLVLGARRNLGK